MNFLVFREIMGVTGRDDVGPRWKGEGISGGKSILQSALSCALLDSLTVACSTRWLRAEKDGLVVGPVELSGGKELFPNFFSSVGMQGWQHASLPYLSPNPGVCSNACALSRWCHPTISSSATHFSSCLQSVPASGTFILSQLFPSGGQNIGASTSASVLLMNIQDWFPLGWTGWISLQSKGLSRVFSNTTV